MNLEPFFSATGNTLQFFGSRDRICNVVSALQTIFSMIFQRRRRIFCNFLISALRPSLFSEYSIFRPSSRLIQFFEANNSICKFSRVFDKVAKKIANVPSSYPPKLWDTNTPMPAKPEFATNRKRKIWYDFRNGTITS